ncbi:vWA domain-containing protein [Hydrogenimonas sp.]
MHFLHPEFLYLMLFPAALLVYLIQTDKDVLERIFDAGVLERLRISGDALGRAGHNTLIFIAFLLMALALARPVIDEGDVTVKLPGSDTVVALDLSASMRAKDFYPDRLAFAKRKLEELLPTLPAGRIGLIGFAGASFIVAPPTTDREALLFLLKRLDDSNIDAPGSDLMAALEGAAKLLKNGGVVLLVSDGGEARDMAKPVAFAREHRLEVVVWMVATSKGAPIPPAFLPKARRSETVVSRANGALKRLAEETGGLYVPATLSKKDEAAIARWFRDRIGDGRRFEKVVHRRIELFYYPLALALLILPFALYSIGRRGALPVLILAAALHGSGARAGLLDFLLIDEATKAYEAKDYKQSAEALERLLMHNHRPEAWFDLGDAYYKAGRYKMACDAYGRVVTRDPRLESAKLYNLGNCYARLGELEKAAQFYEKVLEIWDDPDARHNLAVVREAMKHKRSQKGKGKKGPESRAKKGGEGAQASRERAQKPAAGAKRAKRRHISANEERKWMEAVTNQPIRSKLYPLTPPKEQSDGHPW